MQMLAAMRSALSLAQHGIGICGHNPSVGCVILNSDMQLVSSARTGYNGRPHAEQIALKNCSSTINGGTAFVTLEPCAHNYKNISCASLIVNSGIKKVYIACLDPDKRTSGKGISILKKGGLEVFLGMYENTAKDLNRGFFSRIIRERPQVALKVASSLDGKIANPNGNSKWITGELARRHGHMQRATHDAVLVGINTVLKDNPTLTCRIEGLEKQSPIRIIVDSALSIPLACNLIKTLDKTPVYIWTSKKSDENKKDQLNKLGVNIIELTQDKAQKLVLLEGLHILANIGINNLLVEGGGKVAASLLSKDLIDKLFLYRSGVFLGDDSISSVSKLDIQKISLEKKFLRFSSRELEDDVFEEWKNVDLDKFF